jgi:hypothetical protein
MAHARVCIYKREREREYRAGRQGIVGHGPRTRQTKRAGGTRFRADGCQRRWAWRGGPLKWSLANGFCWDGDGKDVRIGFR